VAVFGPHPLFVQRAFDKIFSVYLATEIVLNEGLFYKQNKARKLAGISDLRALSALVYGSSPIDRQRPHLAAAFSHVLLPLTSYRD